MFKNLSFRLQQAFDPFAMFLRKGHLKDGFLDIYLTVFFGAVISGNPSAMSVILFRKCLKINIYFKNAKKKKKKKNHKPFIVFDIIVSELVAFNCLY